jgi:capsular polysaccharide biosynthesis protein
MELKEYIKTIKKNFKLILVIGVIACLSAFLFSIFSPVKYEISLSLLISKNKTQNTDDFKYDGYYAFQASEMLSDTIVEWAKSPAVVNAIYQEASVVGNFGNIKSYTKKFTAKKMSSQHIEIKFNSDAKENAEKISAATVKIINSKVLDLRKNSEDEISFSVSGENPVIVEEKPNSFLNMFIGFISGLILGIFIVFGKEYFRD